MTRVVTLTGGIGSGKSTVAAMLSKLGATLIDADAIVHELQSRGSPLLAEIVESFGPEVLDADGELEREALAARVFRDPAARRRLEALVHPRVRAEFARRLTAAVEAGDALVVLDIPLYYETRSAPADAGETVLLAYVPRELQIERTMAREGCSREQVLRRLDAQLPIEEKRRRADVVIDNSGSRQQTERQVRAFVEGVRAGGSAAAP